MSEKTNDYAAQVAEQLRVAGIRTELNDSPEKIGAKIRKATLEKVPYMAVVGQREAEASNVSLRHRTDGDKGPMSVEGLIDGLNGEIATKGEKVL